MINKISKHPRNSPSFYLFYDQVKYFVDMAISRYDLGKSWPTSQAMSMAKVIYETNQPINLHYFCFVQIGPCIFRTLAIYHLTLNFRGKGQCRIQGKISINVAAISVVIVAKTDSKYGINACIGIYFFCLDCILIYKLQWNIPVTNGHISLRKYYLFIIDV